jgi:O-antigen/teichoic acid export membrane protein
METDQIAVFIPIVGIVMGIGIGMLALYLGYRKKRDIYELHHKERMAAIEKGIELPPLPVEFFRDGPDLGKRTPEGRLRSGLVLLFVGVALAFALSRTAHGQWVWGLIPAAVGLANLLSYALGRKKAAGEGTPPADPKG